MTITTQRFQETKKEILQNTQKRQPSHIDIKKELIRKIKETETGMRVPIPVEYINLSKNKRLDKIDLNDPEFLQLVASIREVGILQSPLISIVDNEIVALMGNRRIAASKVLNDTHVICEIKHFTDTPKNTLSALIENTARKNWNVIAISKSLQELHTQGYEINKLADLLGKDRKTIGRLLKVANWNQEILDLIQSHPDKIKIMSVLQIASRTLSEEEILNRLKSLAGVIKVDNKEKKFAQNKEKVVQFIKRKKLSGEQEKLVFAVLKEFGFLNKG